MVIGEANGNSSTYIYYKITIGYTDRLCGPPVTVRASYCQRIMDNYAALLQEWTISLDEKLQSNIRGRIIGCQAQMNTFDFFFGLNLGQRLFSHTNNLSRTLQRTKMSAPGGVGHDPRDFSRPITSPFSDSNGG